MPIRNDTGTQTPHLRYEGTEEFTQRMQRYMPRYGTDTGCGKVWKNSAQGMCRCAFLCEEARRDNDEAMMAAVIVEAQMDAERCA